MWKKLGRGFLLAAVGVLCACSDQAVDPVRARDPITTGAAGAREQTVTSGDRWNMADVEADFPGLYSLDTTQTGNQAPYYLTPSGYVGSDLERGICRDHFKPIDLWWDGGYGNMRFHLDPPLLFVSFRPGTFRSPRGLVFNKAVYETIQPSEAVDPAGNVWRFQGRFNALCRGGELELGPVVFGGQFLVSENPLSRPELVRRGSGDGCDDGAGGDWHYMESYDPYAPAPEDGESTVTPNCSGGAAGSNPGNSSCYWDYITLEISYDGGETWHFFWSGWTQICNES